MKSSTKDLIESQASNFSLLSCVEVGKLLISTYNLSEILELIMLKISQLIPAQNWSLLLKDEKTGELSFEIVVGIRKGKLQKVKLIPHEGIAGHVVDTGEPVFIPDVQKEKRFSPKIDALTGFMTKSIVCIPLKIHGNVLGVIEIINMEDIETFKFKDYPSLSILIDFAAIAIENAQYFLKIQRMSITDEYTDLYNARYLHQILGDYIQQTTDNNSSFAIVLVDIDNFKTVVDCYGHLLGSEVLKEVGQTMLSCLADKDILIKYGGDEYVLLLPDKNKQQAQKLLEKILKKIRSELYLTSDPNPVKVTASFGVAIFPEDADNKKDLLLLADNMMFDVKKTTKNGIGVVGGK